MVIAKKYSKSSLVICLLLSFILSFFVSSTQVFAVTEEQAMKNLTVYVYGSIQAKEYVLDGGGSISGKDLFEGNPTEGYDLKESEFNRLSSKSQSEIVSDIATYSNQAVEDERARGVEESTVETWWKQLQTKQGVGSKFMTEILKNTKPDFVTANRIFEPFSGPISTLLGVIAVAVMSLLGVVMVSDIAYIVIPFVRVFANDNYKEKRNSNSKSLIFSYAAMHSVELAENGGQGQGGGENKQALGIYFKRRAVELIILGICLMYLVNGNLYTLVGYILDLVSGFLGF